MIFSRFRLTIPALRGLGLSLIAALTCLLYVPFLGNELIFDDHHFFTSLTIYDYAVTPFRLSPRNFPYFTLGFTEVMWKSMEIHRCISLLLHLLNAFLIYRLLACWTEEIGRKPPAQASIVALLGCLFFAIHPVAAYGAGYLVQRTILFATLFSLLTLWFYWRSLTKKNLADSVTAALFYSLAIFSKEHAIMLPMAALLLTPLAPSEWPQKATKAIIFAIACTPAAIFVILFAKGIIGVPYEPDAANFSSIVPVEGLKGTQWIFSAITQAGLFFKYGLSWLWPDVRAMSGDIRVDFSATWTPAWIAIKLAAFFLYPLLAGALLRRQGTYGLIGWGLLYFWLLFATEFVSIRLQEPFVLYRSYLWAPGIITALTGSFCLLNRFPNVIKIAIAVITIGLLFGLSQNRLSSMVSEEALWSDASAKLAKNNIPGAERIFYNQGIQKLNHNQAQAGLADMEQVVSLRPDIYQGYIGRAKAYQSLGQHELALSDLEEAIRRTQDNKALRGSIEYDKALSLQALDRINEAEAALIRAANDGHIAAKALMSQGKLNRIR